MTPSIPFLIPRYLTTDPADPFALNGPLRYKRTGRNDLLYSIGPDGVDDGGKPIVMSNAAQDGSTIDGVKADSKGDIIAGANTQ